MLSRTPDKNFISFASDGDNGKTFDRLNGDPRAESLLPRDYDDLIKVSGRTGLTLTQFTAASDGTHREDGIDINNESVHCTFRSGVIQAGKKGVAITNKGGNIDTRFENIVIIAPYGKYVDIEDGNHSDQSWKKTTGTIYNKVKRLDGKPVRYAYGRADKASFVDTDVKVVWWYTAALHVYVYVKQLFYPSNKK